jgi:hypothetical protein
MLENTVYKINGRLLEALPIFLVGCQNYRPIINAEIYITSCSLYVSLYPDRKDDY